MLYLSLGVLEAFCQVKENNLNDFKMINLGLELGSDYGIFIQMWIGGINLIPALTLN